MEVPREAPRQTPAAREAVDTQPVAFAGGRYVYGMGASMPAATEIRRKTRQRVLTGLTAAPR